MKFFKIDYEGVHIHFPVNWNDCFDFQFAVYISNMIKRAS